nr:amidohydrolase/deacetylase family metallohydrolase [Allomuricauda sp.]
MRGKIIVLLLFCMYASHGITAQEFDIAVLGGHVIDPKNDIDEPMDVAIKDGKIALVSKKINEKRAKRTVDAKGLYVVPGLVDMHAHGFFGVEDGHYLRNSFYAVSPDGFTFRNGVTTMVDAGSSGWKSFKTFKEQTIDRSHTRVLAFLNIVGEGMKGGAWEQDTYDMDAKLSALMAKTYPDLIVGFKVAHFRGDGEDYFVPIDRAIEAGNMAGNIPVMLDGKLEDEVLRRFRPGDIFTHTYGRPIIDTVTNKVKPFVREARQRGLIFDVGYGGASFMYSNAIPGTKDGFFPDVISTDLHGGSMNAAMKDIMSIMSKFMALGMGLEDIITAVTWKPAKTIKRPQLGNLSVGSEGDVAIFNIRDGKFGFYDQQGEKMSGTKKFECEVTIKGGRVFYDLNGLTSPLPRVISGVPRM